MFLRLLEKERLKRGWTQEEVALKIGVARSTYANYEKGKREPDFETSQKFAVLFETTIDYLLGLETKHVSKTEANKDRELAYEAIDQIEGSQLKLAVSLLEELARRK